MIGGANNYFAVGLVAQLNINIPMVADITEAAIIPTLAICLYSADTKAKSEINIDIVKPIPAKKATP